MNPIERVVFERGLALARESGLGLRVRVRQDSLSVGLVRPGVLVKAVGEQPWRPGLEKLLPAHRLRKRFPRCEDLLHVLVRLRTRAHYGEATNSVGIMEAISCAIIPPIAAPTMWTGPCPRRRTRAAVSSASCTIELGVDGALAGSADIPIVEENDPETRVNESRDLSVLPTGMIGTDTGYEN